MTITKEKVLPYAQQCLPFLLAEDEDVPSSTSSLSSKDISIQQIARLWGGKGYIYKITINKRTKTTNNEQYTFVMKHITASTTTGSNYDNLSIGDRRKALSYHVEANFYKSLAEELLSQHPSLALPRPYVVDAPTNKDRNNYYSKDIIICMSNLEGQDFDSAYYSNFKFTGTNSTNDQKTTTMTTKSAVHLALDWLATFHASHWNINMINGDVVVSSIDQDIERIGLQPIGSYWYLETRPDEHASMPSRGWEGRLKRAARAIDECLQRDPMQCIIHGDPKSANIMLIQQRTNDAAKAEAAGIAAFYDFQYCGKGSPTRDLAYFLCTSCDEDEEEDLVVYYHEQLVAQLRSKEEDLMQAKTAAAKEQHEYSITIPTLEHLKDSLSLAYADFGRFMVGWGFWGFDIRDRIRQTLDRLDGGKDFGSEQAYIKAIGKEFW
jgi:hypothetical protein